MQEPIPNISKASVPQIVKAEVPRISPESSQSKTIVTGKAKERAAVDRIGQEADDAIKGKIKTSEALAGILGVSFRDRFIGVIYGVRERLAAKLIKGELSPEQNEEQLKMLDAFENHANEMAGKYMKKPAEGIGKEADSGEIKSYTDSEIVQLIAELRGEKQIDTKYKDNPIEAANDFFKNHMKRIVGNEKVRELYAKRMGITQENLMTIASAYNDGLSLEQNLDAWHKQALGEPLFTETNEDTKERKILKKGAMVGGILSALMALQVWQAMKKEQGQGGQQMG